MAVYKIYRYIKTKAASAPIDDKVLTPSAGSTYIIDYLSFTAPCNEPAGVKLLWDGEILEAAQSDKVLPFSTRIVINGDGVKQLVLRLDNSNNPNGALLGVVIYYEETS